MLQRTEGILLHHFPYSDHTSILKIYTPEGGVQSYFYRIGKKHRRSGLLQPLSILDVVSWKEEKKELHQIREIAAAYPYASIGNDLFKNTVVLFLNEVLLKMVREAVPHPEQCHFVKEWLEHFDREDFDPDAHLYFIAHLLAYQGFFPGGEYSESTSIFDLQEGIFTDSRPRHPRYVEHQVAAHFSALFTDGVHLEIDRLERKILLNALMEFMTVHIPDCTHFKSLPVLEEIFR
jgi:DNA repair protein RecO (recombination protein O)